MIKQSEESSWTGSDYRFMARAIQLAKRGIYSTQPNPRVGCVLVKDDRILSEGWHSKAGEAHAEINAIENTSEPLRGASCYVSLEPCSYHGKTPPCCEALMEAGIVKVISAMEDPNPKVSGQGIEKLINAGIESKAGLMSAPAELLNPGFIKRMRQGLPYVRCKLGMSQDAKLSLSNGISQWITSPQSRQDVQKLRAMSSAIITGVETILADDPALNVRDVDTMGRQPIRVIMDSNLRTPITAKLLSLEGETIIFTISEDDNLKKALRAVGVDIVTLAAKNGQVDLLGALRYLAEKKEVNEVLVEAGPTLSGSLLTERLLDEIILYKAPIIMGDKARGLVSLDDFKAMSKCISLDMQDSRMIGVDERQVYKVNNQVVD